ncbi:polysaccharide deacetylase family protein [Ferrovum myxofaciens]|uniref:polysaccharide deacetylase family protein n=1 Tax=Ferrovum myxofaciens TaxID=416213 RepID=UPI003EBC068D
MKAATKHIIAAAGWWILRIAGRRPEAPRISVMMYHTVGANATMSFDPAVFDEQMSYLKMTFAEIVTVYELSLKLAPVQQWTASITFDDGFIDNFEIVLPILQRHSLRATFFICSGFVGGKHDLSARFRHYQGLRPMSWSQIRELSSEGMEIGAHTHSHPLLANLTIKMQQEEMLRSKNKIEDQLGRAVHSFAIPFGNRGTYTQNTLDIAASYFSACCTTRFATNSSVPKHHANMLLLDRVEPKPNDDIKTFEDKVLGRWDVMRLLQRARRQE